jgi:hypothetical protein
MAEDERAEEQAADEQAGEGFREYVAEIDPGTAAEMEALIERLEHEPEAEGAPPEQTDGGS